jgi:hypothetical protein
MNLKRTSVIAVGVFALACGSTGQGSSPGGIGSEFQPGGSTNPDRSPPGNPFAPNPGAGGGPSVGGGPQGGGGTGDVGGGGTGGSAGDCATTCEQINTQCFQGAANCASICDGITPEQTTCVENAGGDCTTITNCIYGGGSGGTSGTGGVGGVGGVGGGTGACSAPDCSGCDFNADPCGYCLCYANNDGSLCTSYCG